MSRFSKYEERVMLPDGGKDMLNVVKGKSRAIEKAERKENSLYLYSEAGIHRIEPKNDAVLRVTYITTGRVQQYRKVRSAVKNRIPGLGLYGNGYGNMAENEKTYACC